MSEGNVIPFAPFASRRKPKPAVPRDKPYAGGGIDELWFGDRPSAVIVRLY
jgi:hypothetical protein